ncbi:polyribonucleotide nucleotidyltransferase [Candidatus Wolfebacteria bacterium]|nr:polyribonucleotide nucleotidyltransferase [Candidatus Wolfebacteria bacterium]
MHTKEYSTEIGGKTLTATFTDLADQANGSVMLRYGNTVVLATAVMGGRREGLDYFPLTVEYEERFYAAGQILGSRFMRREGRPSDEAVLSGRAVDRTIRPLFNHDIRNEVQVVITVLSVGEDDPDTLAVNAASLALATSDIPWDGPVSAVRVGRHKGESAWVINPDYASRENTGNEIDLLVCGREGLITMIETGANEAEENVVTLGLETAVGELANLQKFQEGIIADRKVSKRDISIETVSDETQALFESEARPQIDEAIFTRAPGKDAIRELGEKWNALVREKLPDENPSLAAALLQSAIDEAVHRGALERNERVDGRAFDELRPLFAQPGGISEMLHGSGIFYRGGTHIFSALTLGGPQDSLIIDGMEIQGKKRFMHHYNFPPFSTGETGRIGGFNRRMIGHGALAEKALKAVIPSVEMFPYTIRIVSEAFASNGSTSMGSVCGSTLALMDAGVPITAPVAGIAMGLMMRDEKNYRVLTDIQGPEDHHGDMDLKVAGTLRGITAMQMDIKVAGVPVAILAEALGAARVARLKILKVITDAIPAPRAELSPRAPRIEVIKINPTKIGLVIGGGGKTVNAIKDLTGTEIDIEDDGTVYITGKNGNGGTARAKELIEQITHEHQRGDRFQGEVTRILDFGAFVRLGSASPLGNGFDSEGMVHISELAPFRVNAVTDVVAVGETVPVIVKEIDEHGRINLSIKDADPEFASRKGVTPAPPGQQNYGPRPERGEHRPRRSGPRRF